MLAVLAVVSAVIFGRVHSTSLSVSMCRPIDHVGSTRTSAWGRDSLKRDGEWARDSLEWVSRLLDIEQPQFQSHDAGARNL